MLRPIEDRVLVKVDSKKEATVGGLVIPDTVNDSQATGTVIATGPGKFEGGVFAPSGLKADDKVIYAKHQGITITHDGEDLVLLSPASILAVVVND